MANNINDNQVPSRENVAELLQYLNILYPESKAIDPIRYLDSIGYPVYKDEVNRFMNLVDLKWATYNNCLETRNDWLVTQTRFAMLHGMTSSLCLPLAIAEKDFPMQDTAKPLAQTS